MSLSQIWLPYAQMKTAPEPLEVVRTDGVRIYLDDGRVLIDGIASWWTACHGYNHPYIRAALTKQLEQMPHVMLGGLVHEPVRRLASRLAALLPGDLGHTFFSESGSVAVEVAMKIAVQYWINSGRPSKSKFLSFKKAYHGDTFGAMSVCDPDDGMHSKFAELLPRQIIAAVPAAERDFSQLERTITEHRQRLAALIIEPLVQAAGGFAFHTPEILSRIVEIARRHDVLVIFDEIATGFGRTGSMFACEQAGVVPDIVTLSKALTAGTVPLAATVARTGIYEAFLADEFDAALMHGPTFAGNALACTAANASLDLFESEPWLQQVAAVESRLIGQLGRCRSLPGVRDVRVKGAIGVVELERQPNVNALRTDFIAAGVWIRPFGRSVYLMPALNISAGDLTSLTDAIHDVLRRALD